MDLVTTFIRFLKKQKVPWRAKEVKVAQLLQIYLARNTKFFP